jgi:hypothetical protein
VGGFYASARSFQVGDGVAVIAAAASAANVLGILGGVVVFGDPLGRDAPTVGGRLLAFILVVVAAGLMPAPVRAHRAVQEKAPDNHPTEESERPGRRPAGGAVSSSRDEVVIGAVGEEV